MRRLVRRPRRFRSAVIISTIWRRRVISSPRLRACSSGTGLGSGRTASAKWAPRSRIEGVGLGKPAGGAGEIADLARVHHRQRQPGRAERPCHRRLEAARRLEHDQRHIQPAQPRHQLIQAFSVARDGKGLPRRAHVHVEPILRHINAYEHLFHHPSLRMRSRGADQATVRVHRNRGRGARLTRGLRDQRWIGLPPRVQRRQHNADNDWMRYKHNADNDWMRYKVGSSCLNTPDHGAVHRRGGAGSIGG